MCLVVAMGWLIGMEFCFSPLLCYNRRFGVGPDFMQTWCYYWSACSLLMPLIDELAACPEKSGLGPMELTICRAWLMMTCVYIYIRYTAVLIMLTCLRAVLIYTLCAFALPCTSKFSNIYRIMYMIERMYMVMVQGRKWMMRVDPACWWWVECG